MKDRETYTDLEEAIIKLQSQRDVFMLNKKDFEFELSNLNAKVRSRTGLLSQNDYQAICRRQDYLKQGLNTIQKTLTDYKNKIQEKVVLKEKLRNKIKFDKEITVSSIDKIILLKDKYQAFASDQTRVSSMRVMASQIVQELELIISDK